MEVGKEEVESGGWGGGGKKWRLGRRRWKVEVGEEEVRSEGWGGGGKWRLGRR